MRHESGSRSGFWVVIQFEVSAQKKPSGGQSNGPPLDCLSLGSYQTNSQERSVGLQSQISSGLNPVCLNILGSQEPNRNEEVQSKSVEHFSCISLLHKFVYQRARCPVALPYKIDFFKPRCDPVAGAPGIKSRLAQGNVRIEDAPLSIVVI
jgi:hypothetical protein